MLSEAFKVSHIELHYCGRCTFFKWLSGGERFSSQLPQKDLGNKALIRWLSSHFLWFLVCAK